MADEQPDAGGRDDRRSFSVGSGSGRSDADDGRLRGRLRLVAGGVILLCIVFLVVVDTIGRLLIRPDFHVGDIFLGSLLGALLLLIGVEGAARFPFGGGDRK